VGGGVRRTVGAGAIAHRVDGQPEPRTLRVVESTDVVYNAAAIQMVASCRYDPGKIHGKPVRVLVRQPVTFRPG
jgi:hypothetical protein